MTQVSNETIGKRFIATLIAILLVFIMIYASSHMIVRETVPCQTREGYYSPCGEQDCEESVALLGWKNFASIDPQGRVNLRNIGEIDWYVGGERARDILERVRDRTEKMNETARDIDEKLEAFAQGLLDRKPVDDLTALVIAGDYRQARKGLETLARTKAAPDIGPLRNDLLVMEQQMQGQCQDLSGLTPPLSRMFFWTSPTLSVVEVLFWAFFGVITNLLVSSAEYLRKGTFKPIELWVAYPKLIYGPILAVVMVLAIINGFFGVENYKLRIWTLPLVGFIFGYAARRTARIVDKVIERFLGKTEQGVQAGPAPVTAKRSAMVEELKNAMRPRDMGELKANAKKLAKEMTEAEVEKRRGGR